MTPSVRTSRRRWKVLAISALILIAALLGSLPLITGALVWHYYPVQIQNLVERNPSLSLSDIAFVDRGWRHSELEVAIRHDTHGAYRYASQLTHGPWTSGGLGWLRETGTLTHDGDPVMAVDYTLGLDFALRARIAPAHGGAIEVTAAGDGSAVDARFLDAHLTDAVEGATGEVNWTDEGSSTRGQLNLLIRRVESPALVASGVSLDARWTDDNPQISGQWTVAANELSFTTATLQSASVEVNFQRFNRDAVQTMSDVIAGGGNPMMIAVAIAPAIADRPEINQISFHALAPDGPVSLEGHVRFEQAPPSGWLFNPDLLMAVLDVAFEARLSPSILAALSDNRPDVASALVQPATGWLVPTPDGTGWQSDVRIVDGVLLVNGMSRSTP